MILTYGIYLITDLREKSKCVFSSRGRYEYSGTVNVTCSGVTCKPWTTDLEGAQYQNEHVNPTDADFPVDGNLKESSNYCRNPDLRSTGDWCLAERDISAKGLYTLDPCCLANCAGIDLNHTDWKMMKNMTTILPHIF